MNLLNTRGKRISLTSTWTKDRLQQIASSDDLHIAAFRDDGVMYETPTWIWSVVVNSDPHARAYNGTSSSWCKASWKQKVGQITAAGQTQNVLFEVMNGEIDNQIDAAHRAKIFLEPIPGTMLGDRARSATEQLLPRSWLQLANSAEFVIEGSSTITTRAATGMRADN